MYWSVGSGGEDRASQMEVQDGPLDMGGRQSAASDLSISQSPVTETLEGAYKSGEFAKAQELIKKACQENLLQAEKCHLLSISAAYGDLHAVKHLLKEGCVTLPTEPNDDNPAVLAAYFGHHDVVKELLDSLLGPINSLQLLNWMLAVACKQGHLEVVRLLVCTYSADPDSYAVRKNEFPALITLPLYAAIQAGHQDVAAFLLQNGAFFSSYVLMDCPDKSKQLLRTHFIEAAVSTRSAPVIPALHVNWSNLRLPWVDLDWLIDISPQITELDLSANCLSSVPSVIPWGLINIQKLSLADNRLHEIPDVPSSDGILCSKLLEIDVSANRFQRLPSGILHLSRLQKLVAAKNYLERLFDEENGGCVQGYLVAFSHPAWGGQFFFSYELGIRVSGYVEPWD